MGEELKTEKIDIIRWASDPAEYIGNALNPARVINVSINEKDKSARVVVPDNQLSLAIGKEGQNARLAAKLTGWKIDIKSQPQYLEQMGDAVVVEEAPALDQFGDIGGEAFTGIDLPVDEDDTL